MDAKFAKQMVEAIEQALKSNVGVNAVTVDGQTIQFSGRDKMIEELQLWEKRVAQANGKLRRFRSIDIGSAF